MNQSGALDFRGVERVDGQLKGIFYDQSGTRLLLSKEQIESGDYNIQHREGALHALTSSEPNPFEHKYYSDCHADSAG